MFYIAGFCCNGVTVIKVTVVTAVELNFNYGQLLKEHLSY